MINNFNNKNNGEEYHFLLHIYDDLFIFFT